VKIFVVLPAYNEAENIPSLLEQFVKLKENPYLASKGIQLSIILVDDGSKEQTVQRAKDFSKKIQIIIEQHPHNLGLGQALRTGFKKSYPCPAAYTLGTNPEFSNLIENLQKEELNKELSKASLETLSIVLYKKYTPK